MWNRSANWLPARSSALARSGRASASLPAPPTPAQIVGILGPPHPVDVTRPNIVSEIWVQPYHSPGDFDYEGGETVASRRRYRQQYRDVAITKSAVRGKVDDISCLKLTALSGDKDDPRANAAAEFVEWTIAMSPRGSRGVIDCLLTPGVLDGWAVAEKTLEGVTWKGERKWGLAHLRSLDTTMIRLQTDQYREVISVANLVRGLEYFSPDQVVLYAHNPLFNNPFGLSDVRAASRAANIIEDVYKLWYLALRLYGLPFMQGKAKSELHKPALAAALATMRDGGYCVTGKEDEIVVLNLAAAAATDGFEKMVHTMREDNFFAIRGAALPFMEGDGGQDAHGDSDIQQDTSDAGEKGTALDICDCLNRQLVPWLVAPNFGPDCPMPRLKLGGTNWAHTKVIVDIFKGVQEIGGNPSAHQLYEETGINPARDDKDKLVSAQEKQQQAQQQTATAVQPAATEPAEEVPQIPPAKMSAAVDDAVKWVSPAKIVADPERFQFRRGHDQDNGTIRPLPDETFDAKKCPPLVTWVDPESDEEHVVDGHHRLAWAERDSAKRVPVQRIQAKSAEEAKELGKRLNQKAQTHATTFSAGTGRNRLDAFADDLIAKLNQSAA